MPVNLEYCTQIAAFSFWTTGRDQKDLDKLSKSLKQFNNITLFSAELKPWSLVKIVGLDNLFLSYSHSKGLQFLLNYSAKHQIETAVFLDQDCILNRRIDPLIQKLSSDIWLVGSFGLRACSKKLWALRKRRKTAICQ